MGNGIVTSGTRLGSLTGSLTITADSPGETYLGSTSAQTFNNARGYDMSGEGTLASVNVTPSGAQNRIIVTAFASHHDNGNAYTPSYTLRIKKGGVTQASTTRSQAADYKDMAIACEYIDSNQTGMQTYSATGQETGLPNGGRTGCAAIRARPITITDTHAVS